MVSAVDAARRELVKLLRTLALVYGVACSLTRDSPDADVLKCFKQVSRKAHPDKKGKPEHQKALNAARDKWEPKGPCARPWLDRADAPSALHPDPPHMSPDICYFFG